MVRLLHDHPQPYTVCMKSKAGHRDCPCSMLILPSCDSEPQEIDIVKQPLTIGVSNTEGQHYLTAAVLSGAGCYPESKCGAPEQGRSSEPCFRSGMSLDRLDRQHHACCSSWIGTHWFDKGISEGLGSWCTSTVFDWEKSCKIPRYYQHER